MKIERTEVIWLDARSDYSVLEIAEMSGLPRDLLDELIDCGVLPVAGAPTTCRFEAESIVLARAARRLRDHFELDGEALAVAISLLRRVRALEAELNEARARSTIVVG